MYSYTLVRPDKSSGATTAVRANRGTYIIGTELKHCLGEAPSWDCKNDKLCRVTYSQAKGNASKVNSCEAGSLFESDLRSNKNNCKTNWLGTTCYHAVL